MSCLLYYVAEEICFFQDPSIYELWAFPFLPQHVADRSDYFPQPLWQSEGISVLHWFPSILHPFITPIMVTYLLYKYTNEFLNYRAAL